MLRKVFHCFFIGQTFQSDRQIKMQDVKIVGSQHKSDALPVTVDKRDLTCLCCDLSSLLFAQVKMG